MSKRRKEPISRDALLALPAAVELWPTAGQVLGLGRSKTYELARAGQFPVRVLRLGNAYRVPTAELLALLSIDPGTRHDVVGDGAA